MNKRLRQAFQDNRDSFKEQRPIIRAILGNGRGVVETSRANYVYARLTDGNIAIVLNKRVSNIDGLAVFLGFTEEEPFVMQVLGEYNAYTIVADTQLPDHATSHRWPYSDTVYIEGEQFLPWLTVPYSGTSVQVYAGMSFTLSGTMFTPTQDVDLQSYVPATGAFYALIGVNATGAVTIQPGPLQASVNQLIPSHIPVPVSGTHPVSAVRLKAGQTVIQNTASVKDIVDLRFAGYSVLSGQQQIFVYEDGVLLVAATEIDFVGAGVSVSVSGTRAEVTITDEGGGGGGGGGYGLHPGIVTGTLIVPADWRMIHLGPMTLEDGASVTLESGTNAILL